ncbi:MAG: DNA ligase D [Gemmatimonadetes bacterium]|nr:DNA ligase D [Gemmatimonadota bacterium]
MALEEYTKKRDFRSTPEPSGDGPAGGGGKLRFVIQKHDASRLHYDFRLEMEGVLRSWAVPKGPSLDPAEKRLAVHVEDHPLSYGDFEGVIPQDQYGGGTVLLWDRGTWDPDGDPVKAYRKGRLTFRLEGEKLHGAWNLVRMGGRAGENGKNWLLIKSRDDEALDGGGPDVTEARPESVDTGRTLEEIAGERDRVWDSHAEDGGGKAGRGDGGGAQKGGSKGGGPKGASKAGRSKAASKKRAAKEAAAKKPRGKKTALPKAMRPQLATLHKEAPAGEDWLHEIKYDGYRLLVRVEKGRVTLLTRRGKDWTDRFPGVAEAAAALPVDAALLDGEAVVVLDDGTTDFQALQEALGAAPAGRDRLVFYAFDLLHLDGVDLTGTPLSERKEALRALLEDVPEPMRYSDHVVGTGPAFFQKACEMALEGIISKRADAPYRPGRGRDWIKVKCQRRQEFVVGGFTEPSGARTGLGALLLGVHSNGTLVYAGKVGTGFTADTLAALRAGLERIERKTSPFGEGTPTGAAARGVHWVTPRLVVEVEFTEWTRDGQLRHPSFKGVREDKPPEEVTVEMPEDSDQEESVASTTTTAAETKGGDARVLGVRVSSPQRVLWPDQGVTKVALARYYEQVSAWMLPYVEGRPLSLVRCPKGTEEPCFFQKHPGDAVPDVVSRIDIEEKSGTGEYVYVTSAEGLVALVQIGTLEIHGWGSRVDRVERPDHVVFDLDPDEDLPWKEIVRAARETRELLSDAGLESWVRTTGGKGLHVVAPLTRRSDFDEVKAFARAVADAMVERDPERYTANMSKAKRKGRIFVDYLRNGRGATAIVPFSTRARPGAPVSVPVTWDEVARTRSDQFGVETLPRRLERLEADPWEGFFDARQSITRAAWRAVGGEPP